MQITEKDGRILLLEVYEFVSWGLGGKKRTLAAV